MDRDLVGFILFTLAGGFIYAAIWFYNIPLRQDQVIGVLVFFLLGYAWFSGLIARLFGKDMTEEESRTKARKHLIKIWDEEERETLKIITYSSRSYDTKEGTYRVHAFFCNRQSSTSDNTDGNFLGAVVSVLKNKVEVRYHNTSITKDDLKGIKKGSELDLVWDGFHKYTCGSPVDGYAVGLDPLFQKLKEKNTNRNVISYEGSQPKDDNKGFAKESEGE
jgi:hypothetical protein